MYNVSFVVSIVKPGVTANSEACLSFLTCYIITTVNCKKKKKKKRISLTLTYKKHFCALKTLQKVIFLDNDNR